jgi:hypothetical protein
MGRSLSFCNSQTLGFRVMKFGSLAVVEKNVLLELAAISILSSA